MLLATLIASGCTTLVQPTTCEPGATTCGGIHDARFCEHVATELEGRDCAALGLAPSGHFCVVTTTGCRETTYAVREQDCRVLRYETVRDAMQAECPPGAPTFVNR